MQLRAGAIGITCAKLGEAEVMARAGIHDILIANQIVGADKIARLVNLAAYTDVMVAVDDPRPRRRASRRPRRPRACACACSSRSNVGMDRCGVQPGQPALDLARSHAGPARPATARASWATRATP